MSMGGLTGYNTMEKMAEAQSAVTMLVTIMQRLQQNRVRLERQLADVNEAIAALEKNPEVENIINLLGRSGY